MGWVVASLLLAHPLESAAPMRVLYPLQATGFGTGWGVDPATGSLTLTMAGAPVPGDLPIPVVFRYNASPVTEIAMLDVWTLLVDPDSGRNYRTYVPTAKGLTRNPFGTLHFGFITTGDTELISDGSTSTKDDVYHPLQ